MLLRLAMTIMMGANQPLTIQHAVDSVQPGDTILVHAGTYVGARIEQSGTAVAHITLRANDGETVLINQSGPNNRHDSNLELETWEGDGIVAYWVIEGLEVADAPNWGIDVRGSESAHSHHITIRAITCMIMAGTVARRAYLPLSPMTSLSRITVATTMVSMASTSTIAVIVSPFGVMPSMTMPIVAST